jgi:hypothetical protein
MAPLILISTKKYIKLKNQVASHATHTTMSNRAGSAAGADLWQQTSVRLAFALEIVSGMIAGWADLRGLLAIMDVSAFPANPGYLFLFPEESAGLHLG